MLTLIDVPYISFAGERCVGQLVVSADLAQEVQELFEALSKERFPIHKIVPIAAYAWDDEASMADNNTSAFNYRSPIGKNVLSNHAYGRAIDINPLQNPYYAVDGIIYPKGAVYDPKVPGTLVKNGLAVNLFREKGWRWLGERAENTDYQHFDKAL